MGLPRYTTGVESHAGAPLQASSLGFFPAAGGVGPAVAICLTLCHNLGLPLPG